MKANSTLEAIGSRRRTHHWGSAVILLGLLAGGCGSGEVGTLYITTESNPGCVLSVVKIIEPASNASRVQNMYGDHTGTESYQGVTWRKYPIEEGSWDVYFEYDQGTGTFSHRNGRESVFIEVGSSGNEWAAVWVRVDNSSDSSSEQGSGSLSLTRYPY